MSDVSMTFTLTDAELDAVSAGQASATLTISTIFASGPASATVAATGLTLTTASVGGSSPSQAASVSGSFSASSS